MIRFILLSVFALTVNWCSAQQDFMMLNLSQVRQSSYVNPALGNTNGIHIGLPFLSSVSAEHRNNFLHPQDLFETKEGHVEFQTDVYRDMVKKDNRAGFDLAVDVLSFGFPIKENYFSFAIREKTNLSIELPGDLLLFPLTGNAQFDVNGGLIDLSDMSFSLNHYTEYGFGWQRNLSDDLSIGVRAKVLFGKENLRTKNNDFQWQTDLEDYTYSFNGDFSLQTSGLASQFDSLDGNTLLENGKVTKYLLASKNLGFGLDLGVQYNLNSRWSTGFSLVDLGYIRYNDDIKSYSGVGSDVAFAGVEISEAFINGEGGFSDSLDAAIADLGAALERSTSLERNQSSYSVGLNTKAYFNLGYSLLKRDKSYGKAGLIVYTDVASGKVSSPMATLSYTHSWNDILTVSGSYSLLNQNAKNLGLAMSVKSGPVVYYIAFDNIMWINMTKIVLPGTDGEINYPGYSSKAAVHFGINLLLAQNKKGESKPRL